MAAGEYEYSGVVFEGNIIGIELPNLWNCRLLKPAGIKGDTATGVTKSATLGLAPGCSRYLSTPATGCVTHRVI